MKNAISPIVIKEPRFNKESGFETTLERSKIMGKIRSFNTRPELILRKALWKKGVRYRLNVKKLPGCPDIVINKSKIVVFVDGDFWHGYNWEEKKKRIKSNREFWIPKIERTIQRDKEINLSLFLVGYIVLRFWEHELQENLENCVGKILSRICGYHP